MNVQVYKEGKTIIRLKRLNIEVVDTFEVAQFNLPFRENPSVSGSFKTIPDSAISIVGTVKHVSIHMMVSSSQATVSLLSTKLLLKTPWRRTSRERRHKMYHPERKSPCSKFYRKMQCFHHIRLLCVGTKRNLRRSVVTLQ